MSRKWSVEYRTCPCGKRGFTEQAVDKALGKAIAKRNRAFEKDGTRRGQRRENRYYECTESDLYHLTSQSRRENQSTRRPSAEFAIPQWSEVAA